MDWLKDINSLDNYQLSAITYSIALWLSKDGTADELNTLGNLVSAVGALISMFAAREVSGNS